VGGAFLAASYAARKDESQLPDYRSQRASAESRLTVALVGLVGGGALAAAGIVRYTLVRRRGIERLAVQVTPGGVLVGGRF
jgi:hypothetical protein